MRFFLEGMDFKFMAYIHSIIAHKLLLTYVVDKRANFDGTRPERECKRVADCIALAHYYDLKHVVAPQLARDIKNMRGFWTHMADEPRFYSLQ